VAASEPAWLYIVVRWPDAPCRIITLLLALFLLAVAPERQTEDEGSGAPKNVTLFRVL
jgi:hypothetical protein